MLPVFQKPGVYLFIMVLASLCQMPSVQTEAKKSRIQITPCRMPMQVFFFYFLKHNKTKNLESPAKNTLILDSSNMWS